MNSQPKSIEQKFLEEISFYYGFVGDTLSAFLTRFSKDNAIKKNQVLTKFISWNEPVPVDLTQKLQDELEKIYTALRRDGCELPEPKRGQRLFQPAFQWLWQIKFAEWQQQINQPLPERREDDFSHLVGDELVREGRSLKLTAEQQVKANIDLSKFGSKADLAAALGMSRTTINKFFKGEPVQVKNFHAICKKLKFDWQPESATPQSNAVNAYIDELVREVRDRCCNRILTTCNRIQLYTLKQIDLEQLFVPVFVSQEPSSQRESSRENLPPSPALEIVNRHQHLMILGKPGAGKSTLASYLATTCCKEASQAGWIPVLLRLSDVVDTCLPFNLLELLGIAFDVERTITQQILKSGKVFLILDGLDEVSSQLRQSICQETSNFVNSYYANKVVITCRTDVKDYKLPSSFERVEIADFDETQQNQFIKNWFSIADKDSINWLAVRLKQHPKCTDWALINHFQDNQRLQELAKTPILLSLICLVYVSQGNLPDKRSSLYKRGLDILLEDWDKDRGVKSRIKSTTYKSLSSDDKQKILSDIARYTFEQSEDVVVFEQTKALEIIANYQNYSPQDSLEILEGIAADHGLLFRSGKKWEFSHLTFQEYFVAQWFVQHQDWHRLTQHIHEIHWREIFLLAIDLSSTADNLLKVMRVQINTSVVMDEQLISLISWAKERTESSDYYPKYKLLAYYIKLALDRVAFSISVTLHYCDNKRVLRGNSRRFTLKEDLKLNFEPASSNWFDEPHDHFIKIRFRLYAQDLMYEKTEGIEWLAWLASSSDDDFLEGICDFELENKLKILFQELLNTHFFTLGNFNDWWKTNGKSWLKIVESLLIEHRNIGCSWKFNNEQKNLLQKYYTANKLLAECLNIAQQIGNVSEPVRQEIEETLLLPISNIQARKS